MKRNLGEDYTPTYFLAALGNGGLAVTFYMYLHFLVPHKGTPMAIFPSWRAVFDGSIAGMKVLVAVALLGIVVMAFRHYHLLIWNLREYTAFKKTPAYQSLRTSQSAISIATIPLTLAMSVNVFFVLGGVFVPGLWDIVEYLFPAALLMFLLIGVYALRIFVNFATHNLTTGSFDCARNNSLSQMIAIFAFAMVAVGFAAPAAMSQTLVTSVVGMIGSLFFLTVTVMFGMQQSVLGFRSMLEHGIDHKNSPSLWIIVPIVTLIGISVVRLSHGLHVNLNVHTDPGEQFVVLIVFISIQLIFGAMGYFVMKQVGYFRDYVNGDGRLPGAYALICPGVALFVFGMFVVHMGLIRIGLFGKFSIPHFVLLALLVYLKIRTLIVLWKLDRKLLFTKD